MPTRQTTVVLGFLVLLVGALSSEASAAERCNGKVVDLSASPWEHTIRGTEGPDVIRGGRNTRLILGMGGRDTICGGDNDNKIDGGSGSDTMLGQGERDFFIADPTDSIAGGGGADVVSYHEEGIGVEVDLDAGEVRSVVLGEQGGRGAITSVRHVVGTDSADDLRGDRRDNRITARDGDDFVDGRRGKDTMRGGAGTRDEVSYASAPAEVKSFENPANRGLSAIVRSERDELVEFEVITGSDFHDDLAGSTLAESLYGGEGDDTLKGLGGTDRLFGGPGNDNFVPGPDNDYVEGGANRPVTGPREPGDLINYRDAQLEGGADHLEVCFDIPLCGGLGLRWNARGEGEDVFKEIESARGMEGARSLLEGDNGPNVLVGGRRQDYLHGFGGNDFAFGFGGTDSLRGDDGDDYLDPEGDNELMDGGAGTDTCLRGQRYASNCETPAR